MGKKKQGGKLDRETKELEKLRKKVKGLKKSQKKLLVRLAELEKAVASFSAGQDGAPRPGGGAAATRGARQSPGAASSPSSLPHPNYPQPMKPGKYSNPAVAEYRVTLAEQLTPTVMRVVAEPTGADHAGALGLAGEYIRVITGKNGEVLGAPTAEGKKPGWGQPTTSTKYTVRRYDRRTGQLEINVVLHETGAGTVWVRTVAPGQLMYITGAKSGYRISNSYDFYLLAGDETGLPGMARFLETLPPDARGAAFIEVPDESSEQQLAVPRNFEVTWVDSGEQGALAKVVQAHPIPAGAVFTWLAGESGSIQPLRAWVRRELEVPKDHSYAKGYWKRK